MLILDPVAHAESSEAHSRPSVYREGDQWIVRGSALGMCPLRVALRGLGNVEPVTDRVRMAWRLGHEHERIVKGRLRDRGYVITGEQETIELQCGPIARLRGHTDANSCILNVPALGGEVDCVLEVKSMSEHHYERWLAMGLDGFPNYAKQISFYSHALDKPILYAVQCKSDLRLSVKFVAEAPVPLATLQAEVFQIIGMIIRLQGGEPVKCDRHEEETFPCAFSEHHVDHPASAAGVLDDPAVAEMAARYKALGEQVGALEEEQKELKVRLGHALDLSGCQKARAGDYTLGWQSRETTHWGDFLRDYPDMAERLQGYKGRSNPYLAVYAPRKKAVTANV